MATRPKKTRRRTRHTRRPLEDRASARLSSSSPHRPSHARPLRNGTKSHKNMDFSLWRSVYQDFQREVANIVVQWKSDTVIIAPTGGGKNLIWLLPLAVHQGTISLVITPYRALGLEGEQRYAALISIPKMFLLTQLSLRAWSAGFSAIFLHFGNKSRDTLQAVASGQFRVVFTCPESLEGAEVKFLI
jgi:superfamily II DNA helicase RecQ